MGYAKRVDNSQAACFEMARKLGVKVKDTSWAGRGLLDGLCADWTGTWVVDCKSKYGKFTPAQKKFLSDWPGDWYTWETPEDVIETVNKRRGHA